MNVHTIDIAPSYRPEELVKGATILMSETKKRKKFKKAPHSQKKSDEEVIMHLLKQSPKGILKTEVFRALGKDSASCCQLVSGLIEKKQLFDFSGLWFDVDSFKLSVQKLVEALTKLHHQNPKQTYLSREKALEVAGLNWSGKPLEKILQTLVILQKIKLKGTLVALYDFQIKLTDRQEKFIFKIVAELERSGANVPSPREISFLLKVPIQAVEEILELGLETKKWIRIGEDIYYTLAQLEKFQQIMKQLALEKKGFSAADVRNILETSRKYAIPLLEYFDEIGFTTRVEDLRYVNESVNTSSNGLLDKTNGN